MRFRITVLMCALTVPCQAATVSKLVLARGVDENSCSVPKPATQFDAADRQAFAWFRAEHIRPSDDIKVEWLAPDGSVALEAPYRDLPAASSLCFVTRLPIAGFEASSLAGSWSVRVISGGRTLASTVFRIAGDSGALRVTAVSRAATASGMELTIDGSGFGSEAMVHIAQYTPRGGWRYISAAQPRVATASQLIADHPALPPAEYLVIVRNGDGQTSKPMPFVVSAGGGYKLPTVAGEPWIVTQGPYGAFSHWGRNLHAYDIAPRSGRCIVAMRAGIVHVHDTGMRQDHTHKTYGNYITIDHGDGQYSHYAHLLTGSFVVREGQHVEQGQALAVVGNSGYTLGEGGGYHVHVHVTRSPSISSQSIPFVFEDHTGPMRGQTVVVSQNRSLQCDCRVRAGDAESATAAAQPQFTGSVGFAEWWSDLVSVPQRARSFEVKLTWPQRDAGLDLHLMSPSGHHYAWYADPTGYSAAEAGSQQFRIQNPEAGTWRISVQSVRGSGGAVDFAVSTSGVELKRAARRR